MIKTGQGVWKGVHFNQFVRTGDHLYVFRIKEPRNYIGCGTSTVPSIVFVGGI
jgi:hypothetical protein